jgi:flagellar basal body-associated protein FliL
MLKKENGITLVALVVTIVVLLILATVTINMALNNNGIFGRAKNATNTYKQAEANEAAGMNDIGAYLDNAVNEASK